MKKEIRKKRNVQLTMNELKQQLPFMQCIKKETETEGETEFMCIVHNENDTCLSINVITLNDTIYNQTWTLEQFMEFKEDVGYTENTNTSFLHTFLEAMHSAVFSDNNLMITLNKRTCNINMTMQQNKSIFSIIQHFKSFKKDTEIKNTEKEETNTNIEIKKNIETDIKKDTEIKTIKTSPILRRINFYDMPLRYKRKKKRKNKQQTNNK